MLPSVVISVDVGIRNLATAVLARGSGPDGGVEILDWRTHDVAAAAASGSGTRRRAVPRADPALVVRAVRATVESAASRGPAPVEAVVERQPGIARGEVRGVQTATQAAFAALGVPTEEVDPRAKARVPRGVAGHAARKAAAVDAARAALAEDPGLSGWARVFEAAPKRDDLADALLQGLLRFGPDARLAAASGASHTSPAATSEDATHVANTDRSTAPGHAYPGTTDGVIAPHAGRTSVCSTMTTTKAATTADSARMTSTIPVGGACGNDGATVAHPDNTDAPISLDFRERELARLVPGADAAALPIGDAWVGSPGTPASVVVERKSFADLLASRPDGRLAAQRAEMREAVSRGDFGACLLVIESRVGSVRPPVSPEDADAECLRAAARSLAVHGVPALVVRDTAETAAVLREIARALPGSARTMTTSAAAARAHVAARRAAAAARDDPAVAVMCAVRGVGRAAAEAMLAAAAGGGVAAVGSMRARDVADVTFAGPSGKRRRVGPATAARVLAALGPSSPFTASTVAADDGVSGDM